MEFVLSGFIRTFAMRRFTYKRCKSAIANRDERKYNNSHNPFICLYDVCGLRKLKDYVELFLFNSSKCEDRMKTINLLSCPINGLVTVSNDQVVTTSLKIAEVFEKRHCEVLRSIRNNECSAVFQERNFAFSFYHSKLLNGGYKKQPMYYITKDGFTFLAMGFTGKVAAQFKEAYINAFNEMEKRLAGATIKENEIVAYLRSLCEDVDTRMKGHDEQLQKKYGSSSNPAIVSPTLFCSGSIREQLDYVFKALCNDILAGQFAWAKLEFVERENKEMKRKLAKMAGELLNYYY